MPNIVFAASRTTGDNINIPISIPFTVGGTATFASDYTVTGADSFSATSGSMTIPSGQNSASMTISTVPDTLFEPDETIVLTPIAQAGSWVVGTQSWTATIINDDASPSIRLRINFQGADNSTISDSSFAPKTIQVFGNTKILNNVGVFDGDSDYIQIAKSQFDISALTNYTVQVIYKPITQGGILLATYNLPNQGGNFILRTNNLSTGLANYANFTSNLNVRNHIAFTRSSGVYRTWLNGTLVGLTSRTSFLQGGDFFVGGSPGDNDIGTQWFNGDIVGIKITNTVDYSGNDIIVPTSF